MIRGHFCFYVQQTTLKYGRKKFNLYFEMKKKGPSEDTNNSDPASSYFKLQASWGLTKHMGGRKATRELMESCKIDKSSYVLDIGSGVGITACLIAKEYGCRVTGIDLSDIMVKRARERAERKGVEDKVEFQTADAENLPFADNIFDAVVSESVNAFMNDKQKAVNEYKRVLKPGGYAGFNEVTWVETAPEDLESYLHLALGGGKFLTPGGWKSLLEDAGFSDIVSKVYKTNAWRQWTEEVKQMDPGDFLKAWRQFISLYFKSREIRRYIKEISRPPCSILRIFRYFGYGLYIGRK